jgi:hypothetical protein
MNKKFSLSLALVLIVFVIASFTFNSLYSTAKPAVNTSKTYSNNTTATLSGLIKDPGGKQITEYGFKWGTNRSLEKSKTLHSKIDANKSFSVSLTGLKPGTTYYYQAYAINSKGCGYGSIKSFTVPAKLNVSAKVAMNTEDQKAADTAKENVNKTNATSENKKVVTVVNKSTNTTTSRVTTNSSSTVSRGTSYTNSYKYPLWSKVNGSFGQFRYRNTSGGRIEVDPNWIAQNIVTITLPGLNRSVQVNRAAKDNFIYAFTLIKNGTATINGRQVSLLSLVKTMDGTFVTRHVNWDPSRGLSNHSWGTAIDINADSHFRYVDPNSEPYDPNVILWEKAFKPAGFSWGNSYSDSMHFELLK